MKLTIGMTLLILDLMFVVAGVTCLVIGGILSEREVSSLVESLLAFGFIGIGTAIGSVVAIIGSLLVAYGAKKYER